MEQLELELKRRLARRKPSEDFTARVMARVGEPSPARLRFRPAPWRTWRWAMAGTVAASLTVGVFVANSVTQDRSRQRVAAERAEAELAEALLLAGSKINRARTAAWGLDAGGEEK